MRTIPKLDPILFSKNTHLKNMLEFEFDLDINAGRSAFINKYAIGYTLDNDGDPMIMFEFDGCLFWRAYFRTVLYNTQVELG